MGMLTYEKTIPPLTCYQIFELDVYGGIPYFTRGEYPTLCDESTFYSFFFQFIPHLECSPLMWNRDGAPSHEADGKRFFLQERVFC
jgi:hypothetical protein